MKEFKRSSYVPGHPVYETQGFVFKNIGKYYDPVWACEELGIQFSFAGFGNGNDAKMTADIAAAAVLHDRQARLRPQPIPLS